MKDEDFRPVTIVDAETHTQKRALIDVRAIEGVYFCRSPVHPPARVAVRTSDGSVAFMSEAEAAKLL